MVTHGPRIYLCTTEWLAVAQGEAGYEKVVALLDRAQLGEFDVVASELLRIELLDDRALELASARVRTWAAIDRTVATEARRVRSALQGTGRSVSGRYTPDVIHMATALVAGTVAFISNDGDARTRATTVGLDAFDRGQFPLQGTIFDA